jgi:hypothetical protein
MNRVLTETLQKSLVILKKDWQTVKNEKLCKNLLILNYCLVEFKEGFLFISINQLEDDTKFRVRLGCKMDDEYSICLPFEKFAELINTYDSDYLAFELFGNCITIHSDNGKVKIKSTFLFLNSNEFPVVGELQNSEDLGFFTHEFNNKLEKIRVKKTKDEKRKEMYEKAYKRLDYGSSTFLSDLDEVNSLYPDYVNVDSDNALIEKHKVVMAEEEKREKEFAEKTRIELENRAKFLTKYTILQLRDRFINLLFKQEKKKSDFLEEISIKDNYSDGEFTDLEIIEKLFLEDGDMWQRKQKLWRKTTETVFLPKYDKHINGKLWGYVNLLRNEYRNFLNPEIIR